MKKLFLVLAFAFAGIFTANAQVWLGGSARADVAKGFTGFGIAPEIGYSFNNVPLTLACAANFNYAKIQQFDGVWDLTLTPYVRYTVAQIEEFSVALDALAEIGVKDITGFKAGIRPVIAWQATERWTAAFSVGFLGYDKLNIKDGHFVLDFETAAPRFGLYYNF